MTKSDVDKRWIMKKLIPMTFFNLEQNKEVEYCINIVNDFNYIQRFDLKNPELPKLVCQVYADVYDGVDNCLQVVIKIS